MPKMLDLAPPARQMARIALGISDDQLGGPTPCTEYTVEQLLGHVLGLSIAFRDAAHKTGGSQPPRADQPADLDSAWRKELPVRLEELAAAWLEPAAWEGMTEAGGVALPGDIAAAVAIDELVLHGWDLARATGQEFSCDPVSMQVTFEFAQQSVAESGSEGTPGLFGPPVDVPEEAPMLERALGLSGRDPAWTP